MKLTVLVDSKQIGLDTIDAVWPNRRFHTINDDSFWNSLDQDIRAIQYHTGHPQYCEIEMKTSSGKNNVKLSIQDEASLQKFVDKFNEVEAKYQQIVTAQKNWDIKIPGETSDQKVARLGPRPELPI